MRRGGCLAFRRRLQRVGSLLNLCEDIRDGDSAMGIAMPAPLYAKRRGERMMSMAVRICNLGLDHRAASANDPISALKQLLADRTSALHAACFLPGTFARAHAMPC